MGVVMNNPSLWRQIVLSRQNANHERLRLIMNNYRRSSAVKQEL
jgi:hypothetical protein